MKKPSDVEGIFICSGFQSLHQNHLAGGNKITGLHMADVDPARKLSGVKFRLMLTRRHLLIDQSPHFTAEKIIKG